MYNQRCLRKFFGTLIMSDILSKLNQSLSSGLKKGLSGFLWIMKIILPVSLLVALVQWTGWFSYLDFLLKPVMALINLPPEAFLPIVAGLFTDVYGSIAAMATLPFSLEQMALIAIFSTISHSLIIEGIIQGKSGINITKITVIRITASVLAVLLVSQFFTGTAQSIGVAEIAPGIPLTDVLIKWGSDILILAVKVFLIVIAVMISQEILISLGLIKYFLKLFKPVMKLMGLSDGVTTAWLVAVLGGVTIGAVVIIDECRKGLVSTEELEYLHVSIGINHSMIEQIAVYGALGLNVIWIVFPRLLMSVIAVQTLRGWKKLKQKFSPRA